MTVSITVAGTSFPVPSNAANTNWAAQVVSFWQALAAAIAPPTWVTITPATNWSGSLQCWKDSKGWVWMRGNPLWDGGGNASGETIGALPSGYRPSTDRLMVVGSTDGAAPSQLVKLHTGGTIENFTTLANGNTLDFGQVFFDVQSF
jgi:hypothetical protein